MDDWIPVSMDLKLDRRGSITIDMKTLCYSHVIFAEAETSAGK